MDEKRDRILGCLLGGAGGDTDTVASIAGQVADSLIGRSSIDEALATRLPALELVERTSVSFARVVLSR